jgi:type II secretory pathway pseudopilin PulG
VSSSGLIYAGIVGAWAVYLVPVWLRREEQLNEAREKARYAAAIRTLGRSERFEKKVLAEESLAATGTDNASNPRQANGRTPDKPGTPDKPAPRKTLVLPAKVESVKAKPTTAKPKTAPAAQQRRSVSAHLPHHRPSAKPSPAASAARRRGVLLMRRRRVVAALFTLATLGAVVSTFQGLDYIWAMLAPAALFSGYVVYIRRDEKQRARERFRRRQAAMAAERRRERQQRTGGAESTGPASAPRTAAQTTPGSGEQGGVGEPESTVWRPAQSPQEYRRAANG